MKQIRFKWKYVLASIALANLIACSSDGIPEMDVRQDQAGGSRTTEMVTKTVTLQTAGTLQNELKAVMGDTAVATIQKLVLSGPFTSEDMTFVRDSLTALTVIDMKDAQIKASNTPYKDWYYFEDNQVCEQMFYDMNLLKEVVLPSTVKSLESDAFSSCDSLSMVALPSGVKSIKDYAFYDCVSLQGITLPDSLEELGYAAFLNCKKLSSVRIPGGVKEVGGYCFYGCDSVAEIVFSEGVETIGDHSFAGCHQTKTVDFPASVKNIYSNAFYSCNSLQKFTVPATVTSVGDNFVRDCSKLKAVVWNPAIDVPYCYGVSNCFLFVDTDQIGVDNLDNWNAIVIKGYAETAVDVNKGDWNGEFANLTEFTAKKLVYSRYFGDETRPGGSSGWQTIVLPFTPDSIYHETKGRIAPFNSGIEGAKPFWLRELTSEGFVDVTTIEPNKSYIIAMPNHSDYLDEYRLNGTITFVARDSVLRVTPEVLETSVGPEFELHPTYKYVEQSESVYSLVGNWGYYEEEDMYYSKSFFIKNYNSVQKFNAYVTTLDGGRSSRSLFGLDTRSKETRASYLPNKTGVPQIGDM